VVGVGAWRQVAEPEVTAGFLCRVVGMHRMHPGPPPLLSLVIYIITT
jgi:hypothetical protein